jgi:Winged helix-turn-helix DNA-binding
VEKCLAMLDTKNRVTFLGKEERVPRERVSMRKLLELLRLHFDLKLSQRQIAGRTNLGQSTVNDYLARFSRAGLSWPGYALCQEFGERSGHGILFSHGVFSFTIYPGAARPQAASAIHEISTRPRSFGRCTSPRWCL